MPRAEAQSDLKKPLSRRRKRITIALWVVVCLTLSWWLRGKASVYFGMPNPKVDYLALMTERARAVPEEERAWPVYREALVEMAKHPGSPTERTNRKILAPDGKSRIEPPQVVKFLSEHRDLVAEIKRGARVPRLGFVPTTAVAHEDAELWPYEYAEPALQNNTEGPPKLFALPLRHFRQLRVVRRILEFELETAIAAGDGAEVVRTIDGLLTLALQMNEVEIGMCNIFARGVLLSALRRTRAVLTSSSGILTDEDLAQLATSIRRDDIRAILDINPDVQRWEYLDNLQQFYTDDGAGDGRLSPWTVYYLHYLSTMPQGSSLYRVESFAPFLAPTRSDLLSLFEEAHRWATEEYGRPLWQIEGFNLNDFQRERLDIPSIQRTFSFWHKFGFWLHTVMIYAALERVDHDATLAAIACVQYRRASGDWPQALADLVPAYLDEVPIDAFDGNAIRYAPIDGAPVLYSVGTNGIDEGGVPGRYTESDPPDDGFARHWYRPVEIQERLDNGENLAGDWILWRAKPLDPDTGETHQIE